MKSYRKKIKDLEETKKEITGLKQQGKKIVFTNGCFDIIHPGHIRYLYAAGRLGDHLIVAVNSDRSVRAIKGEKRPVLNENVRAEILAAIGFVDSVIIFDEETPYSVIDFLRPDILVKGGDWAEDMIVGSDLVKSSGGKVIALPFEKGFSTTAIINKINRLS